MRYRATITRWRGNHGFLELNSGSDFPGGVFCHEQDLPAEITRDHWRNGVRVEFEVEETVYGIRAAKVVAAIRER